MRSDIERHVKVPTRCIDCAARCSGVVRWASPESLSKRAPSTTRTSLRIFRTSTKSHYSQGSDRASRSRRTASKAISELRKALGDESHAPRFIATIPANTSTGQPIFSATRSDRSPLRRILAACSKTPDRALAQFRNALGLVVPSGPSSLNGPSDDPSDDSLSIPRPSRQPRRVRLSSGPLRSRDGSGRRPAGVCRGVEVRGISRIPPEATPDRHHRGQSRPVVGDKFNAVNVHDVFSAYKSTTQPVSSVCSGVSGLNRFLQVKGNHAADPSAFQGLRQQHV